MSHQLQRVRHELRRRSLVVDRAETVTPGMRRVVLKGDDLEGFASLAPDDHVKLFLSLPDGGTERRDYTPRRYDAAKGELSIDFALHDAGPPRAGRSGPSRATGSRSAARKAVSWFPTTSPWWLLVGDETALPAIGRRLEELPAGTKVTAVVAVAGPEEQQGLRTAADLSLVWVHRPLALADDPAPVLDALRAIDWPAGEGFVWIAAEASVARAVRAHVVDERGQPAQWLRASGYWKKGVADSHETIES